MKAKSVFLFIILISFVQCENEVIDFNGKLTDGFCLVSNDVVVLNHYDIDYYDYSSHLIYLNSNKSFNEDIENIGEFKIYADSEEIYSGQTHPGYSSSFPIGPIINTHPSFYGDYIVPISLNQFFDTTGNTLTDPRDDEKIVKALKKYNQFHAGLSCEIKSIQYFSSNNVKVEFQLKNNDTFNYYFIDPDKTGIALFHYFTPGLVLQDLNSLSYFTHKINIISAEPWNSWNKDWMSIIKSNETKTIIITYNNFEEVGNGEYRAVFKYPGLTYQVDSKDIVQENGRIWLGKLPMTTEIIIE